MLPDEDVSGSRESRGNGTEAPAPCNPETDLELGEHACSWEAAAATLAPPLIDSETPLETIPELRKLGPMSELFVDIRVGGASYYFTTVDIFSKEDKCGNGDFPPIDGQYATQVCACVCGAACVVVRRSVRGCAAQRAWLCAAA